MVTIKHLIIATVLTAYTYALLFFTTKGKRKDDIRPDN